MCTTAQQKLHLRFPLVELPGIQVLSHLHCSPSPFSVALQSSPLSFPQRLPFRCFSVLYPALWDVSHPSFFPGFLCDLWYSSPSASLFPGALPPACLPDSYRLCTLLASVCYGSSAQLSKARRDFHIGSLLSTVRHKKYRSQVWFRSGRHPKILLSPEVEICRTGFIKSWLITIMVFIKPLCHRLHPTSPLY